MNVYQILNQSKNPNFRAIAAISAAAGRNNKLINDTKVSYPNGTVQIWEFEHSVFIIFFQENNIKKWRKFDGSYDEACRHYRSQAELRVPEKNPIPKQQPKDDGVKFNVGGVTAVLPSPK